MKIIYKEIKKNYSKDRSLLNHTERTITLIFGGIVGIIKSIFK